MLDRLDKADLSLIVLALFLVQEEINQLIARLENALMVHIREQRRLVRSLPVDKKRVLWTSFCSQISDSHFRRMFRMELPVFSKLCQTVCDKIGEETFRPEAYLLGRASDKDDVKFISGEVKMAVCLRLLAGGSYLDLVPLFSIATSYVYQVFGTFLGWMLLAFEFPLVRWLRERNWEALNVLANGFAEKSNGVFHGPFGALDGLALRIRSPTLKEVADPGNYYCRKGFYALNVQAICDKWKRFLWVYPTNKGSTHDSSAFGNSRLLDLLKEMSDELYQRGLFIVGDSAYGLAPYLLVPYDANEMKSDPENAKDGFNYHLSACRIYIECAFGELVMRWGIFWRTLLFDLKKCPQIVQVAMLLHNFIVEHRENGVADGAYFSTFSIDIDELQLQLTNETGEAPNPLVTDNNEPRPAGRRSVADIDLAIKGSSVRQRLTTKLAVYEMKRPLHSNMRYNSHGHIYMTD